MRIATIALIFCAVSFGQPTWRQIKNKPMVDVTDAPYNAKGDGTTDDTSAVAAALAVSRSSNKPLFFPVGLYKISSSLPLITGDALFCANLTVDRWRSNTHPCALLYTGVGDLFTITPTSLENISSIHIAGLSLITTTGRYAINMDATLGAIFGVKLDTVSICDTACQDYSPNGWTNGIRANGAVFDITCDRCTIVDNRGNLVHIDPDHGELGGGNQWTISNSYLIPTANGTWAIKAVGSTTGAVLGTIHILYSTIAEAAATGANGIWVNGGLKINNSLVEGNGAKAGTVGIRVTGSTGGFAYANDILTWDKNVQIGDPAAKTWVATEFKVKSRILAGGTNDIEIVDGGDRSGTEIGCLKEDCVISNLRETTDDEWREVTYDNTPLNSAFKDFRGVGLMAGSLALEQKTSGEFTIFTLRNATGQDSDPTKIPFAILDESGNLLFSANVNGSFRSKPINFADLPTTGELAYPGTIIVCKGCAPNSNPCTAGVASDFTIALRDDTSNWVCE